MEVKQKVLAKHLIVEEGVAWREALELVSGMFDCNEAFNDAQVGSNNFSVYNDDEGEDAYQEAIECELDSMIEGCPDNLLTYLNYDAMRWDLGVNFKRPSALATADGMEHRYDFQDEPYFVYKRN